METTALNMGTTIRHATCMLQWRKDWRVAEALDSTEIVADTREMRDRR